MYLYQYQSATLACIYHSARQNGTAGDDILDITGWYFSLSLIKTLWWSHLYLFLTASGNVHQWSPEPYMEAFN